MIKKHALLLILLLIFAGILFAASDTDDFNRGDTTTLGANWTLAFGSPFNPLSIVSNHAGSAAGAQFAAEYYSANTYSSSQQFSKGTVVALLDQWGVDIFMASAALTGYGCGQDSARTGNSHRRIWEWNAGNLNSNLASDSTDLQVGDQVECRSDGAGHILMFVNNTQILSATNSDITSGQPGIEVRDVDTIQSAAVDDWSGGDVGSAPPPSSGPGSGLLIKRGVR